MTLRSALQASAFLAGLATLPAAAQTVQPPGGALTGGGSVRTPVYCDGTSWTSH